MVSDVSNGKSVNTNDNFSISFMKTKQSSRHSVESEAADAVNTSTHSVIKLNTEGKSTCFYVKYILLISWRAVMRYKQWH